MLTRSDTTSGAPPAGSSNVASMIEPLASVPADLSDWDLTLKNEGGELEYSFDANAEDTGVPSLIRRLERLEIGFKDLNTRQSSLEDIFVSLVHQNGAAA